MGRGFFLFFSSFPFFLRSSLEGGGNAVFSFRFLRLLFDASAWKAFFLFSSPQFDLLSCFVGAGIE